MLRPQFNNQLLSSFLLWADNKICNQGAFQNFSGTFYPINSPFNNYYSYGAVDNQFVADSSISGAIVMTGVYFNNTQISTGQSGFVDINFKNGYVLFNNNVNNYSISGAFSVKDFNIVLTDKQDDIILFKNKYSLRPKFPQTVTGVDEHNVTYPVIFVKLDGAHNEPYAFGGTEETNTSIKCIILADSLYNLNAVENIFLDSVRTQIALFSANDIPFNARGGLKAPYSYTGIAAQKIDQQQFMWVHDVSIPKFSQRLLMGQSFNYDVFLSFADFTLKTVRMVRNY